MLSSFPQNCICCLLLSTSCSKSPHPVVHHNILGKLMYAYVICCFDIGYAVCFLARFSESQHEEHYKALKQVCSYLCATKSWGIMYQRPEPLMDLPFVAFEWLQERSILASVPSVWVWLSCWILRHCSCHRTQDPEVRHRIRDSFLLCRNCLERSRTTCRCNQLDRSWVLC